MPKIFTPPAKPDPGPKVHGKDNDFAAQQAAVAWIRADMAWKESQPQVISDGGKGVSN